MGQPKTNMQVKPTIDVFTLADDNQLKRAVSTSFTEKFHAMTRLMKLNKILKSAKTIHKRMV